MTSSDAVGVVRKIAQSEISARTPLLVANIRDELKSPRPLDLFQLRDKLVEHLVDEQEAKQIEKLERKWRKKRVAVKQHEQQVEEQLRAMSLAVGDNLISLHEQMVELNREEPQTETKESGNGSMLEMLVRELQQLKVVGDTRAQRLSTYQLGDQQFRATVEGLKAKIETNIREKRLSNTQQCQARACPRKERSERQGLRRAKMENVLADPAAVSFEKYLYILGKHQPVLNISFPKGPKKKHSVDFLFEDAGRQVLVPLMVRCKHPRYELVPNQ